MRYLLCPDKFKGSLSATDVCRALRDGILSVNPSAEIDVQPLADGGDGSIEILDELWGLTRVNMRSVDPLGRPLETYYFRKGAIAFIELASASGLALLGVAERNPGVTSTYGTGLVIRKAIEDGCTDIRLFIGGSATNDAAMGIARAVGYEFLDAQQTPLDPIGSNLSRVEKIQYVLPAGLVDRAEFTVVCDVSNPFAGTDGAAYVYAGQKGADNSMISALDKGLRHFAGKLVEHNFPEIMKMKGAGAAGGVGGGMVALLNAKLVSGIDMFFELFDLIARISAADIIVTGEGSFDDQSFKGKVVGKVCRSCSGRSGRCLVVCGVDSRTGFNPHGPDAVYAVMDIAADLEGAMKHAAAHVTAIGRQIALDLGS